MQGELEARTRRLGWALMLTVYAVLSLALLIFVVLSLLLILVWVGLPLTMACRPVLRALANRHRRFAAALLGVEVPSVYLPTAGLSRVDTLMETGRDRGTWADLSWLVVNSSLGLGLSIGAVVECALGLVFWWLPRSMLLLVDAQVMRAMLAPSEQAQLAARVRQLTLSRAETVDTQATELRRIERDLHDGAQARLVALGMSLGLAQELLEHDPDEVRRLLVEARTTNSQALSELRDLVRGIHPPVLADRGLLGAVQALVLTTPLPVEVTAQLPGRLPLPVESAAYFAVAEALANAIKHSSAASVAIDLRWDAGLLRLRITDDGVGGADPTHGTGLRGIERRLAAFDGTLSLTSPAGGPTVIEMELPCASS